MDLFEAMKGRRSIRSFLDRDADEELLKRVLDSGRLAPSAEDSSRTGDSQL